MRIVKTIGVLLMLVVTLAATISMYTGVKPLRPEYPAYFGNRIYLPADNPLTEEGVQMGRMLFYDTRLSANRTTSCATCHRQELAFTDGKMLSTGFDGSATDRNAMALVNLLWVKNLFWDGRAGSLEKQAMIPLTHPHEMGQTMEVVAAALQKDKLYKDACQQAFGSDTLTGDRIVKALAQFERTLISCNSGYDKYLRGEYQPTASELRGIALFYTNPTPIRGIRGAGCGQCHGGPKTFIELFHNNGLDSIPKDEGREKITGVLTDRGRFRVVTLRNIALTAPYMHDGRFATLEAVLEHYNEHIQNSATLAPFLQSNSNVEQGRQLQLTKQEQQDVIAFLHLLTDSSFITEPKFSNPFVQRRTTNIKAD